MTATAVLDPEVLQRLGTDVQNGDFAVSFARRYCSMLEARVQRIVGALLEGDLDAAMDAVLSLKVSSTTVGTCELAQLARAVEQQVRCCDIAAARQHAADLASAAGRAELALSDYLVTYAASRSN
ncbi:Hpt domain-containing protein [Nocardioides sp. SOB77]|uniref:Hpt domain-containing protein n=1 Tax=Nocardioides oceani TaxID=3058369 RepID=A0ABT8FHJ6_9ACTN|nr:Hpt domain-containing protein [Nocardioides oceani]MDN4174026.1 Hpt domain-containing protein [Nocardioides oceani]